MKAVCDGGTLKVYADGDRVGNAHVSSPSSSDYGTFSIPDDTEVSETKLRSVRRHQGQ